MYKIVYINDTALYLMDSSEVDGWPADSEQHLLARYPGKRKFLLHYVDMLEKSPRFEAVGLYAPDLKPLWQDFLSQFVIVEAAGGMVRNTDGETLFIFRRGSWDLPKGKIDKGESREAAALREVCEETGLEEVRLHKPLTTSYHTYRLANGKRILKPTYWYVMDTEEMALQPEAREGIEEAIWMPVDKFVQQKRPVYASILRVLETYQNEYGARG